MILGCIGDDFTGSSDLANTLAKSGIHTVQYCGVPKGDAHGDVAAGVIALKSRTIPATEAVAQSLEALEWLKRQGCRQFFFKCCSTFDSTDEGNIGPVSEALLDELDAPVAIVCPAFPTTGRTLYMGHLFVGDRLLSESGMENHPLTPMRDADIRRVLARQSKGRVGHVPWPIVCEGAGAIREALASEADNGCRLVVVDAIRDQDLMEIGVAAKDIRLVTGGSGIALGLPRNFLDVGLVKSTTACWAGVEGPVVALAGSVSTATRTQVARHRQCGLPAFEIRADDVMTGRTTASELAAWLLAQDGIPLAYSSAKPEVVGRAQQRFGKAETAAAIESLFAETAKLLSKQGVTRFVCAGGETSGAIVSGLGIEALEIGPEIDPGVPALKVVGQEIAVALKSGNFGAEDFFEKAAVVLGGGQ
ncbi:hypothetical protein GR183_05765 [Stappia sp. GBMRC 2046]|uniref:3-oxo-tetronate kinase n=1 Tax=Stappia sediminis TaxID=2692190 RepID=A0A7X3LSQ5_9HYPH|nr:3-oxo-tetronate kinase [Stappia sediminis]MXN64404.1 hypothetical protein [Stappia sediminis]